MYSVVEKYTRVLKRFRDDGISVPVLPSEMRQLISEFLALKEHCAALESREVCTAAHEDVETCGYCQRDALAARLAEAMEGTERLRGLLSRLLGTRNAECRALALLEVAQNNYLDHRQELADYESASLAASACEAEARVAIDAAIAAEQQGAGNE